MRRLFTPFALLTAVSVFAQTPTASVVGRVVDATGAVVSGVSIRISNIETNQSSQTTTNAVGDYTAPFLIPGRYVLGASSAGFRSYKHAAFTLQLDQELRLDIRLEVGSLSETVTVSDVPPALNTESGTRGDVTINAE